jgi:hypothetical protein
MGQAGLWREREDQVATAGRRMNRHMTAATTIVMVGLTALATPAAGEAQERLAVDRWLLSSAFPADTLGDPLETDYLSALGEPAVLPDRGSTVSGAEWSLVREDSAFVFLLPTVLELDPISEPGAEPSEGREEGQAEDLEEKSEAPANDLDRTVVAYAHAYIRSSGDRTLRLGWGGLDCTRVRVWLNGRPVDDLGRPELLSGLERVPEARSALIRVGHGYNTLLVKAASGDCPFGLVAWLEAPTAGDLDGVRVQASRPYGDTRTGPEPWVTAELDAGPEAILAWQGDEMFGAASIRLAAFAVTPIESAEVKARVGGREIERDVEWLTPAAPRQVLVPFEFGFLRRALVGDEGLQLQLKWQGRESRDVLTMRAQPLLMAFHSPIRLLGWSGPDAREEITGIREGAADGESVEEVHPLAHLIRLPDEPGQTLVGEWKIPGWLSGFTLRLDTEGAPGSYRLDSVPADGDEILLCRECRRGETIQVVVETGSGWTRFPGVVIVDAAPPPSSDDATAVEWLELIDEKGSRGYRERAAEVPRD